ncbi:hypothetical protein FB45DRAFT_862976 [Roridomyces roridus]|uniref:Uncharacterized protein n=1 Tax=Roridomyces roridus TaxID=1738132 RepID=A0AAD7FTB0_9AGAR|nr:hypothetical protein FB45DRAFT_862976 [Roridomyces roridus]
MSLSARVTTACSVVGRMLPFCQTAGQDGRQDGNLRGDLAEYGRSIMLLIRFWLVLDALDLLPSMTGGEARKVHVYIPANIISTKEGPGRLADSVKQIRSYLIELGKGEESTPLTKDSILRPPTTVCNGLEGQNNLKLSENSTSSTFDLPFPP